MAAYHWVYDSRHLQADCQEPESALEPYTRQLSMSQLFTLAEINNRPASLTALRESKERGPNDLPANASKISEYAIGRNAKDVNGLLLNRQNCQRRAIQVDTLIVWQVDLIAAETPSVCNTTTGDADHVQCAVFKWRARVGTNGLVVAVDVMEQRCSVLVLGNVRRRTNNDIAATVSHTANN